MAPRLKGVDGRAGLTLLEILIAIALGALVVTVVYSLYHTVSATVLGQSARRAPPEQAAAALDQLSRDLTSLFLPDDEEGAFHLDPGSAHAVSGSVLRFCTLEVPAGEADLRWAETVQVAYRLAEDEEGIRELHRESRPLVGPAARTGPVTNVLARPVESFQVKVHDGTAWQEDWTKAAEKTRPVMVRVDLAWRQGPSLRTRRAVVAIPAGLVFTSRLERASSSSR